jgi:uncharacterized protein YdeI (YjbR/CyaY-like superfamily)
METVTADSRQQWREWLEENHNSSSGVWLVFWKKHTGKKCVKYESSVEAAICFGWVDSLVRSIDEDSYARKFTPRKEKSNWSALNRERALRMMHSGLMTEAGMNAVKTARKNGMWYLRTPPVEMPEELEQHLDTNQVAALFFAELAPSYRKQYMAWVSDAKKPEIRLKRAEEAVRLLSTRSKLPLK